MKVVLDTNVLVSSTLNKKGKPFRILEKVESGDIKLVLSAKIIQELEDVLLRDKIPFEEKEVKEFIEKIISISTVVIPEESFEAIDEDPEDDKILECAVDSNVDYIISGDSHLLNLESFRGVEILCPSCIFKNF